MILQFRERWRRKFLTRGIAGRRLTMAVSGGAVACATAVSADSLTHLGTFTWPTEIVEGLSGLEVSDDGLTFHAIGDRGWFLSGTFDRDDGQITGLTLDQVLPILGQNGLPVSARRIADWSDAEGLAMLADGTYWVSFERWARVARYDDPTHAGQWIKDHDSFGDLRDNRQLEALAIHPDGTLYTFPERPAADGFPVYQLDGNEWSIRGHIAERNRFSIVGADFDDDEMLYILERKLVLGMWWQNRIRRIDIAAPHEDEILWTGKRGAFDNLEGLALWRDDLGLRLVLVSDNNGNAREPAQFVEFRLIETE